MVALSQISIPTDMAKRLEAAAAAMGMDIPAYIAFLEQCRQGRLDAKAQDAVRFMFRKHDESLRKLAQ